MGGSELLQQVYGCQSGSARRADKFTSRFVACPVCSPTRASIMTGNILLVSASRITCRQHPLPYRLAASGQAVSRSRRNHDRRGAETAGYVGAYRQWHLGPTAEYWRQKQGFDVGGTNSNIEGFFYRSGKAIHRSKGGGRIPDGSSLK